MARSLVKRSPDIEAAAEDASLQDPETAEDEARRGVSFSITANFKARQISFSPYASKLYRSAQTGALEMTMSVNFSVC